MFAVNDYVVYRTNGVCKITGIKKEKFGNEYKDYYILTTVFGNASTVYVPTDNVNLTSKMKKIVPVEKIHNIISEASNITLDWIDNDRIRSEKFMAIVEKGDCEELFSLINTLLSHKKDAESHGRKFRVSDKRIMDAAEKILFEEFAVSLNIEPEMVVPFIRKELEQNEKIVSGAHN